MSGKEAHQQAEAVLVVWARLRDVHVREGVAPPGILRRMREDTLLPRMRRLHLALLHLSNTEHWSLQIQPAKGALP